MPACTECRRRKLGCTKELPSCKECRRLSAECVYEAKEKPGLKSGAVENLNRRVDKIELLLQQLQQQTNTALSSTSLRDSNPSPRTASDLLSLFEREMKEFRTMGHDEANTSSKRSRASIEDTEDDNRSPDLSGIPAKRKRLTSAENFDWGELVFNLESPGIEFNLSPAKLLDAVLDNYFSQVHPWLPILHEANFRQQFTEQVYMEKVEVILYAMVVAAVRFVNTASMPTSNVKALSAKRCRDWVMLHAMNSLSVENLQALQIIAFDDIGKGDVVKAWPIVGSLTRTVEYVQLSVEIEEDDEQPLLKPCSSLPPHTNWTEMETRRRVFWNIFNLDRFCSVITGWNTSLTSDDVHRRLPVDGALWRKQQPVIAPYFGIWDKSAGRIGNSITFLPADENHQSPTMSSDPGNSAQTEEMSSIGAFAYAIEATESMSRVTTYFLQQKVNLHDQKQIGRWLTRFKELDLRLVHWKMFLPQKWKDTNISRKPTEVVMDPNLTLAHITHNASMILLHQLIAYPPADWDWASRLPSRCSADTCQVAAVETSSITEKYLKSPTNSKIVNGQFTFCVFVAARVLLVHWKYYRDAAPLPEFFTLIDSLESLSSRWEGGSSTNYKEEASLSAKYASRLRNMHEKCINEAEFRIDVLAYSNELDNAGLGSLRHSTMDQYNTMTEHTVELPQLNRNVRRRTKQNQGQVQAQETSTTLEQREEFVAGWRTSQLNRKTTDNSREASILPTGLSTPSLVGPSGQTQDNYISSAIDLTPGYISNEIPHDFVVPAEVPVLPGNGIAIDDLNSISQMFLDQQFFDMDRVISYDDGMFTANMDWWDQDS